MKSNGNPGWIFSFLDSLKQAGDLEVKKINLLEALEIGLIFTDIPEVTPNFFKIQGYIFDEERHASNDKDVMVDVALLTKELEHDEIINDITLDRNMKC